MEEDVNSVWHKLDLIIKKAEPVDLLTGLLVDLLLYKQMEAENSSLEYCVVLSQKYDS